MLQLCLVKEVRSATSPGYKERVTRSSVPGAQNIHFSEPRTHRDHIQPSQEQPKCTRYLGSALSKSPCWNSLNLFGHSAIARHGCSDCSSIFLRALHTAFLCTALAASPLVSPLNAETRCKAFIFVEAQWENAWKVPVHVWNAANLYHLKITGIIKKRLIIKTQIKQV